jgi:dipeptidyl aminopeptidase/acylaminoacyl peptidase
MTHSFRHDQGTRVANRFFLLVCSFITAVIHLLAPLVAADKELPIRGEVFTIEDRTAFLILPENPDSAKPIAWVWYAPTLRGLPGQEEVWMMKQFLDAGIAIAGVDVGESYGSPEGRAIYSAFYKELVERRGLAQKACLLARSRGGLMLYNWAAENPMSVACIAGIYPVCNLSSYPGLSRACGAYGLSEDELKTQLPNHNPIDRLAALAEAKVPIFHIHGDSDKVVPLEANSGLLGQRYREIGGEITLKIIEGQGHNMWTGWFQDEDLVKFVIAHAKETRPAQAATDEIK